MKLLLTFCLFAFAFAQESENLESENQRLRKTNKILTQALKELSVGAAPVEQNAVGESENFDDYFEQLTSGKCVGEAMLNEIGTSNKDAKARCSHAAELLDTKFLDGKSRGSKTMRALDKKEYPLGCSYNPDFNTVYYNPTNPNYSLYNNDASDTKRAICLKSESGEAAVGAASKETFDEMCDVIEGYFENGQGCTPTATMFDLGVVDERDINEMYMDIEDVFGIKLSEDERNVRMTFQQHADLVQKKLVSAL